MSNVMDRGVVRCEFELHSFYNVHFQTIILRNDMNPLSFHIEAK